ncbi:MAG TPA: UPF0158 family protein [Actinomycetota bacterium]|nr:UPF0158 family protein [Actinomycetota bacterium]
MLDPEDVDLSDLAEALEDHSDVTAWWLDPATGAVEPYPSDDEGADGEEHPEDRGLLHVDPLPSHEGYGDMEDFIARVGDGRARDLLERAIAGRGAFRRFKDTLIDFPDLRDAWFRFHDARMERRAIAWLANRELIDPATAERALRARPDPDVPGERRGPEPVELAGEVARDLQTLYGSRLKGVFLFGSRARGDAHPESDLDLLVVLDRVDSPWDELRRMDELMWRRSLEHDIVISAAPVEESVFRSGASPFHVRVRAEGRQVA